MKKLIIGNCGLIFFLASCSPCKIEIPTGTKSNFQGFVKNTDGRIVGEHTETIQENKDLNLKSEAEDRALNKLFLQMKGAYVSKIETKVVKNEQGDITDRFKEENVIRLRIPYQNLSSAKYFDDQNCNYSAAYSIDQKQIEKRIGVFDSAVKTYFAAELEYGAAEIEKSDLKQRLQHIDKAIIFQKKLGSNYNSIVDFGINNKEDAREYIERYSKLRTNLSQRIEFEKEKIKLKDLDEILTKYKAITKNPAVNIDSIDETLKSIAEIDLTEINFEAIKIIQPENGKSTYEEKISDISNELIKFRSRELKSKIKILVREITSMEYFDQERKSLIVSINKRLQVLNKYEGNEIFSVEQTKQVKDSSLNKIKGLINSEFIKFKSNSSSFSEQRENIQKSRALLGEYSKYELGNADYYSSINQELNDMETRLNLAIFRKKLTSGAKIFSKVKRGMDIDELKSVYRFPANEFEPWAGNHAYKYGSFFLIFEGGLTSGRHYRCSIHEKAFEVDQGFISSSINNCDYFKEKYPKYYFD